MLDEEKLLDEFETGKLIESSDAEEIRKVTISAKNHFKKDMRINIRLSQFDLNNIKRIALSEGLPYQTMISSIIHKFVNKNLDL